MKLKEFNEMSPAAAVAELERCCGSRKWGEAMLARRPFADNDLIYAASSEIWHALSSEDWQEAFRHHPKIGDVEGLRKKFAATAQWAAGEQSGASNASENTLQALAQGNDDYEQKFGYIFIVCATGKSADEMLALLQERLYNSPEDEIKVAMQEQDKITRLRLEKLLA